MFFMVFRLCTQGAGKGGKRLRAPAPSDLSAGPSSSGLAAPEPSGSVPPAPNMVPREQVTAAVTAHSIS